MDKNKVKQQFQLAKNLTELVEIKNKISKELINELKIQIKNSVSNDEKKEIGILINNTKRDIENIFLEVKNIIENNQSLNNEQKNNDSKEKKIKHFFYLSEGKENILQKVNNEILNIFKELQFDIHSGNEVVSTYWNFDALNIPKNHPARAMHDSFFIDDNNILKTHNTSYSAYYLNQMNEKNDIRICSYGPVYRKDDDDATHSHQFMQIDMVWVKQNINIANLKWLVNYMLKKIFGINTITRYRLSFFPFTEPSFEVDIKCFNCNGNGCNICKFSGWIEILGAGVLHRNVLKSVGINADKFQGIAFGIGVERIAMLKYKINDIREFYNNDFDFLNQF